MTVRRTSIEVYHQIKDEGLLSQRRMEVYETLFHHGPLTGNEIFEHSALKSVDGYRHNVHARLAELREMGVVEELGERLCKVSQRNVILWDVTDKLPIKYEKVERETRKQLQERCDNYRKALFIIWKHQQAPKWIKDLIRRHVPFKNEGIES